jgi:hypothetical protein
LKQLNRHGFKRWPLNWRGTRLRQMQLSPGRLIHR